VLCFLREWRGQCRIDLAVPKKALLSSDTHGAFDAVRPASLHFVRRRRQFDCACPAGTAASSARPAGADAIDPIANGDGLLGDLQYPGHELPECVYRGRTFHDCDHSQCPGDFALHSQLHQPTARLPADVQQVTAAIADSTP